MSWFRDMIQREFGVANMQARAARHDALAAAQFHLDMWRDYGSASDLEKVIAILRDANG